MDLAKYQELTGTTVSEADTARYTAVIRRANALLESGLGYSLTPSKNLDKQELGKLQFAGGYPFYPINQAVLLPADEQTGSFRLFPYNENDLYIKTDPYKNVYQVKLVQAANDDEFVTILDLKDYVTKNTRNFGKFVEKQYSWFSWGWYSWLLQNLGQDNGLMVAVDADWLTCKNMPTDLQYLWADMVTYYADPDVSVTGNIKSESVNGHSWTKGAAGGGSRSGDFSPEQSDAGMKLIASYAGPNGSLATRIPTI